MSSLSILSQRALSGGDVSSRVGKSLLMALALVVLTFLSACSSSSRASGVGCPGGAGAFTNASLPAGSQWAYNLSGTISQSNGVVNSVLQLIERRKKGCAGREIVIVHSAQKLGVDRPIASRMANYTVDAAVRA